MPAFVRDPMPGAVEDLIEERARLGIDRYDEVWEGVLHMNPPPSHAHEVLLSRLMRLLGPFADKAGLELTGGIGIGSGPTDYRVPDLALHRPGAAPQWHPTAALAGEILSPGDETWEKLPFYTAHQVDELLVVDPATRTVDWRGLTGGEYRPVARSTLIDLGADELAQAIDWPAVD